MFWTKAKTAVFVSIGVLFLAGTGTVTIVESQSGHGPLGSLMEKKRQKDALLQQMDSMIPAYAAIMKFAQANQDQLPKSLAQVQPYLATSIAGLDDTHWEIIASGKITSEVMKQNGILLQQKNVSPGKAKIIMYLDGSAVYK